MTKETRRRLRAVRAAADRHERQKVAAVLAARSEGGSLREIGTMLGLSHRTVKNILDRHQPRAEAS